ncbi:hypothetical protein EGW08_000918, partial [Elysia chlorotica]
GAHSPCDSPVGGHDKDRSHVGFQRSVQEGEALDVQHVHFQGLTHPWDYLGLALLAPLGDLGVDLLAHFRLDLASVAGEQREETLRAGVDHVDLVKRDGVHDLFAFL